jgi:hypothetical protein
VDCAPTRIGVFHNEAKDPKALRFSSRGVQQPQPAQTACGFFSKGDTDNGKIRPVRNGHDYYGRHKEIKKRDSATAENYGTDRVVCHGGYKFHQTENRSGTTREISKGPY